MAEAIKATLLKDASIDAVITISAGDADSAAIGIQQASATEKVKNCAIDSTAAVADAALLMSTFQ